MGSGDDSSSLLQDRVGTLINDRYRVLRLIGSGSTGAVYLCQHEGLDKWVALKILHREMEQNASLVDRFNLEAKAASRLEHPNSVRVLDFGHDTVTGALFIAMEYIEGRDLLQVLEEDGPFSAERAVSVMCQILDVLGVAHGLGIVHRDLKPENIIVRLVEEDGVTRELVTVCDFGIAQFAPSARRGGGGFEAENTGEDGVVAGTPAYMSPEQARAELQDARSDLYSAGVVLYQLITLHLPFEADDAYELALKHCIEAPPPPSRFGAVNPQLEEVCLRALSKSKSARYQNAREMRVALTRALMATPVSMERAMQDADTVPLQVIAAPRWGRSRPMLPQSTPPGPLDSPHRKPSVLERAVSLPRQKGWLWSYSLGAAAAIAVIVIAQLYRSTSDSSAKARKLAERSRNEHVVRPSARGPASAESGTDARVSLLENAAGNESRPGRSAASAELPVALSAPASLNAASGHRLAAVKPAHVEGREPNGSGARSEPQTSSSDAARAGTERGVSPPQEQGDVAFAQLVEGLTAGGGDMAEAPSTTQEQASSQTRPSASSSSAEGQSDGSQSSQVSVDPAADTKLHVAAVPAAAPGKRVEEVTASGTVSANKKRSRADEIALERPAGTHEQLASAELARPAPSAVAVTRASLSPVHASVAALEYGDKDKEKPGAALAGGGKSDADAERSARQLTAASNARKPELELQGPPVIERARVVISGIAAKSAVSKSSIRTALNVGAMSECYRAALRGGAVSGQIVTGLIELTTSTSGSVTGANLAAPGLPGELRRCVEQVARRGRVREADTGAAQASITLAFMPR